MEQRPSVVNISELIAVGKILQTHGLDGKFKVKPFNFANRLRQFKKFYTAEGRPLTVILYKELPEWDLIKFKEITDRTQAEHLGCILLYVSRQSFPDLNEEEYYYTDLIGLKVWNEQQIFVGTVYQVANYGAGDILEIKSENENFSIIFSQEAVTAVNIAEQRICIDSAFLM